MEFLLLSAGVGPVPAAVATETTTRTDDWRIIRHVPALGVNWRRDFSVELEGGRGTEAWNVASKSYVGVLESV